MQLTLVNLTASPISLLSGSVVVPASGSIAVTNPTYQLQLATDGLTRENILANNIYITDGTNNFGSNDAIAYLYQIPQNLGPTSDASGNPIYAINNQTQTRDVINTAGQYANMSVTTSAAEAKGGSSRLVNRKVIILCPTNGTVYWGTSNSVTSTTGMPIYQSQTVALAYTDNVPIYVISAGTVNLVVSEGS